MGVNTLETLDRSIGAAEAVSVGGADGDCKARSINACSSTIFGSAAVRSTVECKAVVLGMLRRPAILDDGA